MTTAPNYICYYYRENPPFQSVLEMGQNKAMSFLKDNDCQWRSEESYLPYRIEVESWLRSQFTLYGGKPKLNYPIYMSLGEDQIFENDPDYKAKLLIPLGLFSQEDISFTYMDSMHTNEGKQPHVFMLSGINEMIARYGNEYAPEVQIWNKEPLKRIEEEYINHGCQDFLDMDWYIS